MGARQAVPELLEEDGMTLKERLKEGNSTLAFWALMAVLYVGCPIAVLIIFGYFVSIGWRLGI